MRLAVRVGLVIAGDGLRALTSSSLGALLLSRVSAIALGVLASTGGGGEAGGAAAGGAARRAADGGAADGAAGGATSSFNAIDVYNSSLTHAALATAHSSTGSVTAGGSFNTSSLLASGAVSQKDRWAAHRRLAAAPAPPARPADGGGPRALATADAAGVPCAPVAAVDASAAAASTLTIVSIDVAIAPGPLAGSDVSDAAELASLLNQGVSDWVSSTNNSFESAWAACTGVASAIFVSGVAALAAAPSPAPPAPRAASVGAGVVAGAVLAAAAALAAAARAAALLRAASLAHAPPLGSGAESRAGWPPPGDIYEMHGDHSPTRPGVDDDAVTVVDSLDGEAEGGCAEAAGGGAGGGGGGGGGGAHLGWRPSGQLGPHAGAHAGALVPLGGIDGDDGATAAGAVPALLLRTFWPELPAKRERPPDAQRRWLSTPYKLAGGKPGGGGRLEL